MASTLPRTQYHSTSPDRLESILERGLQLPLRSEDVATHRYRTPTISTADEPQYASAYNPSGVLLKLRVKPGSKFIKRSIRSMRRGENLEDAVNRWIDEAAAKSYDGIYVGRGLQSTVGNQILNPSILSVIEVLDPAREGAYIAMKRKAQFYTKWFQSILDEAETTLLKGAEGYTDLDKHELSSEEVAYMRGYLRKALMAIGVLPEGLRPREGQRKRKAAAVTDDTTVYTAAAWWRFSDPFIHVVAPSKEGAESAIQDAIDEEVEIGLDGEIDAWTVDHPGEELGHDELTELREKVEEEIAWSGVFPERFGDVEFWNEEEKERAREELEVGEVFYPETY